MKTDLSASARPRRLIRRSEVLRLVGLSKSTLYERIAAEDFPRPVRVSPRCVAWVEADVREWIDARVRESNQPRSPGRCDVATEVDP